MFMPAGCHFGSWRASAALNEPLRSEPVIETTFTLSAIFKSSKFDRPRSLTRVPRIGEAPALQAPLAAKATPLKRHHAHVTDAPQLSMIRSENRYPLFGIMLAAEDRDGRQYAKNRLDRHGPHGFSYGGAPAQGRPRCLDLESHARQGRAAGQVRRQDRRQA